MAFTLSLLGTRVGQSRVCGVRGDGTFRRRVDKLGGEAVCKHMDHRREPSRDCDADERKLGDVCIGGYNHSQAASRSGQGCWPREPSRSGIDLCGAILVGLLHCSDRLHAGVVQGALETAMGAGLRDDLRHSRNMPGLEEMGIRSMGFGINR